MDDFTDAAEAATEAVNAVTRAIPENARGYNKRYRDVSNSETAYQANALREIFGNPFRAVTLDQAWLTSDVLALTRGIYEEKAFDRMPILADALQDAGCTNEAVFLHCRDTSITHIRGCWVLDLLLGKG